MGTAVRQPPHHNNLTCVKHYGCDRPECRDRHRAYQRDRHHSRIAGTWQPLIDAEPVRLHLLTLYAADFTPRRVSELAGLPFETVIGFTRAHGYSRHPRGRKRRCTPEVAAKILAVTPDTAKPGIVDATGTARRIRALVAAGWPMKHLGPRIGISERTAGALIGQARVYGRTADAVAKVYEQLAGEKPEKHGISPKSASRARIHAARRRWPTVTYWSGRLDVIDDPDFVPDYKVTRLEIVAEEADWLMTTAGLNREQAAERLGVSRSYVDKALAKNDVQAAA